MSTLRWGFRGPVPPSGVQPIASILRSGIAGPFVGTAASAQRNRSLSVAMKKYPLVAK